MKWSETSIARALALQIFNRKQFDLLADLNDVTACSSSYGLCE